VKGLGVAFKSERPPAVQVSAPAHLLHAGIERLFPRVPEGRMPQIMGQRDRFRELGSKTAREPRFLLDHVLRDRAGQLRCLDAVGQAGPVEIGLSDTENLRLPLQSAEGRTV
jgi:hypothetical protein